MSEFSGYDIYAATGAAIDSATPNVERKTKTQVQQNAPAQAPSRQKIIQSEKSNVLNKYRSSTYNFTLAALRKDIVNQPERYRDTALDLIILKSGGKGTQGLKFSGPSATDLRLSQQEVFDRFDAKIKKQSRDNVTNAEKNVELVNGFNKNSPGRFDMFIEDVEIETLMAFTKQGGSTLPTAIKFKVVEPYSINGFIESLHVSAVAAGYPNYTQASFLLKMEFIGYPDNDLTEFKDPQIVEQSTRYFPIKFTNIEVEIGEKGTEYRCSAIPWNEIAFGQASIVKSPISISGKNVASVLKNFAESLTDQLKAANKKSRTNTNTKNYDEYEILFPEKNDQGLLDYNQINIIGQADLNTITILPENANYKFKDPGAQPKKQTPQQAEANPEEIKLEPGVGNPPQMQFAEGQRVHEIIAAIIRDSEFTRDILDNLEKKVDPNGFVDYFIIKSEVINKEELDPVSRKPYQKYRFSIIPYKVHFTRIPTYAGQKYNIDKLTRLSLREYNYVYTGQNIDILNFRLNFNSLFFEAIPLAMGNNDQIGARTTGVQTNNLAPKLKGEDISNQQTDQIPTPNIQAVPLPTITDQVNASQFSTDPYYTLAKNMHSAIIDSKASMLTGEIEILGDPLYLITGGIGNYDAKSGARPGLTENGDADHLQGEVLITINFKNPTDIRPLEQGGLFYFDTEKLPFSGIYRVIKATSLFNGGVFKQRLEIIRYQGQIIGKTRETNLAEVKQDESSPQNQTTQSTTLGINQEGRAASEPTLFNLIGRSLPSPGLPGFLSNFVNAAGGLGGQATSLLTQVSGAVSRGINNLAAANSIFGGNIPGGLDQLASGIRLQASGLIGQLDANLRSAATVAQAGTIIDNAFSLENSAKSFATEINKKASSINNLVAVKGSGIGEGATVLLENSKAQSLINATPGPLAATDLTKQQAQLPSEISLFSGKTKELGSNALSTAISIGSTKASGIISEVNDKITNITNGVPTDPSAVAKKFGIDSSQLSGLDGKLQSKVLNQLGEISKKIPEDTDLSLAIARGLSLTYIPSEKLSNLPPTAPYSIAPMPQVDTAYLEEIVKSGGPQALANVFGVSSIKNVSENLLPKDQLNSLIDQTASALRNPLSNLPTNLNLIDNVNLGNKIAGADQLLNSITPLSESVESKLSSVTRNIGNYTSQATNLSNSVVEKFGSASLGKSPLNKLIDNKG